MAWARYESGFRTHPKIHRVEPALRPAAIALHLVATCYSAELLTDGFVPQDVLPAIAREAGIDLECHGVTVSETVVESMLRNGLLDRRKNGYAVHDYLEYNPSKRDVLKRRKGEAQRQADKRKKSVSPRDNSRDNQRDSERDENDEKSRRKTVRTPRARALPVPEVPLTTDRKLKAETRSAGSAEDNWEPTEDPVHRLLAVLRHTDAKTEAVLRSFERRGLPESAFDYAREEVLRSRDTSRHDAKLAVHILNRKKRDGMADAETPPISPTDEPAAPAVRMSDCPHCGPIPGGPRTLAEHLHVSHGEPLPDDQADAA